MGARDKEGTHPHLDATLPPPARLSSWGIDPAWSRLVTFPGSGGAPVTWHIFDTGPGPSGTIVCVHGNPSWAYLWRNVLENLAPDWRVIAVDQTGMGYSERTGPRRLADRVDELVEFCKQETHGPIVLAAHDWGGPVAVGASASLDVEAVVLANTAVAKPDDVSVPPLIATARRFVDLSCRRTPAFVDGAAAMTAKEHRAALRAPYRGAERRAAIADFVAEIPVSEEDPSWRSLTFSAEALASLRCPILLLWGGKDPVFHDRFLRDLRARAPHAEVERFANAGHFVCLDEPVGEVIDAWLGRRSSPSQDVPAPTIDQDAEASAAGFLSVLTSLADRADDTSTLYEGPDGAITWVELAERSDIAGAALLRDGVSKGERIALLVPPSVELLVAAASIWKVGTVAVVADASGGARSMRKLIRAAAPTRIIGTPATLAAARIGGLAPGARAAGFTSLPGALDLRQTEIDERFEPIVLHPDDIAAIVHTSGATGPAKPVRYTHGALAAQRDVLGSLLSSGANDAFTTSFGAFMLLAPSIGMRCVRPDFNVNKPAELTFDALSAATNLAPVTTAWLSPASARTIVATAKGRRLPLALVMLAGAPIPPSLVVEIERLTGGELRAPYGMTECLPVTDGIDPLQEGPLGGTATGRPLSGCQVVVVGLNDPSGPAVADGSWGEILVSAPWMFDGYDARWTADLSSSVIRQGRRFHRTGDVGYLSQGALFQLGRASHVIETASGPVASVGIEGPISAALGRPVAAVPVGPPGASVIVVVIEGSGDFEIATEPEAAKVRAATENRIAAVLTGPLPTDTRHQSKVDRRELAQVVGKILAGR